VLVKLGERTQVGRTAFRPPLRFEGSSWLVGCGDSTEYSELARMIEAIEIEIEIEISMSIILSLKHLFRNYNKFLGEECEIGKGMDGGA
jgi:hypothetical protein